MKKDHIYHSIDSDSGIILVFADQKGMFQLSRIQKLSFLMAIC